MREEEQAGAEGPEGRATPLENAPRPSGGPGEPETSRGADEEEAEVIEELEEGGQGGSDDSDDESDEGVARPDEEQGRTEGPDEPGNVALRHSTSLGRRASQSATSVGPSPSSIASASRVRAHASTAPPRGSLVFSAAFEGGNLGVVKPASSSEWEIWLRPDTMAPRHRLWFHFQVGNCQADQHVLFSIVNFSKQRSLYRDSMTPLVRSSSRPRWERIPARNVFYYRSPAHRKAYVLSFAFTFDREDDAYEFAYSFPYSYSRLTRHLALLESLRLPYVRRELLCRSLQGRRIDCITVSDPEAELARLEAGMPRPVALITGRVHPGETPSSFVTEGLLNFIVEDSPEAQALRRAVTFVIVPMINPDGCYLGNYRTDSTGVDLNRMWAAGTEALEPPLYHIKRLAEQLHASDHYDLALFMDVHAHSTSKSNMCFCNVCDPEDVEALDRSTRFLKILESSMLGFSYQSCTFDASNSKAGCARRVIGQVCPTALACTLEVSFFISRPPPSDATILTSQLLTTLSPQQQANLLNSVDLNTEERYLQMGAQVAQAMREWFGVPKPPPKPPAPPKTVSSSKPRHRPPVSKAASSYAAPRAQANSLSELTTGPASAPTPDPTAPSWHVPGVADNSTWAGVSGEGVQPRARHDVGRPTAPAAAAAGGAVPGAATGGVGPSPVSLSLAGAGDESYGAHPAGAPWPGQRLPLAPPGPFLSAATIVAMGSGSRYGGFSGNPDDATTSEMEGSQPRRHSPVSIRGLLAEAKRDVEEVAASRDRGQLHRDRTRSLRKGRARTVSGTMVAIQNMSMVLGGKGLASESTPEPGSSPTQRSVAAAPAATPDPAAMATAGDPARPKEDEGPGVTGGVRGAASLRAPGAAGMTESGQGIESGSRRQSEGGGVAGRGPPSGYVGGSDAGNGWWNGAADPHREPGSRTRTSLDVPREDSGSLRPRERVDACGSPPELEKEITLGSLGIEGEPAPGPPSSDRASPAGVSYGDGPGGRGADGKAEAGGEAGGARRGLGQAQGMGRPRPGPGAVAGTASSSLFTVGSHGLGPFSATAGTVLGASGPPGPNGHPATGPGDEWPAWAVAGAAGRGRTEGLASRADTLPRLPNIGRRRTGSRVDEAAADGGAGVDGLTPWTGHGRAPDHALVTQSVDAGGLGLGLASSNGDVGDQEPNLSGDIASKAALQGPFGIEEVEELGRGTRGGPSSLRLQRSTSANAALKSAQPTTAAMAGPVPETGQGLPVFTEAGISDQTRGARDAPPSALLPRDPLLPPRERRDTTGQRSPALAGTPTPSREGPASTDDPHATRRRSSMAVDLSSSMGHLRLGPAVMLPTYTDNGPEARAPSRHAATSRRSGPSTGERPMYGAHPTPSLTSLQAVPPRVSLAAPQPLATFSAEAAALSDSASGHERERESAPMHAPGAPGMPRRSTAPLPRGLAEADPDLSRARDAGRTGPGQLGIGEGRRARPTPEGPWPSRDSAPLGVLGTGAGLAAPWADSSSPPRALETPPSPASRPSWRSASFGLAPSTAPPKSPALPLSALGSLHDSLQSAREEAVADSSGRESSTRKARGTTRSGPPSKTSSKGGGASPGPRDGSSATGGGGSRPTKSRSGKAKGSRRTKRKGSGDSVAEASLTGAADGIAEAIESIRPSTHRETRRDG